VKRLAAIVLAVLAGAAAAEDPRVSLVFDDVRVVDLVKLVYAEVEKRPYVLRSDLGEGLQSVSLDLRNVSPAKASAVFRSVLAKAGIVVESVDGVDWLSKRSAAAEEVFVYRPHYRAATYLVDAVSPFFKSGAFGTQRGLPQVVGQLVGAAASGAMSQAQGGASVPAAVDSGTSAFSAIDKQPDVVVFKGSDVEQLRLRKLLAELDTAEAELLVKAVVFEVSTDSVDRSAIGLAVNLVGGQVAAKLGSVVAGDYSAVFKRADFSVVFDALVADRRFKVVSAPNLRVRNGASARLTVGNDVPILGAVQYNQNGAAVQSVEYKSSGVILSLTPQIREKSTDLQISQEISNFVQTSTGVNGSPTLTKRQLMTTVGVASDDVVIIGGLDSAQTTGESVGFTWLPAFLRPKNEGESKTEILLMLQTRKLVVDPT